MFSWLYIPYDFLIFNLTGPYETGTLQGTKYKHLYFNSNSNTIKIWTITVIALIGVYEAVKYVANVVIAGNQVLVDK